MLRALVRANRAVCAGIERHLPQRRLDISALYEHAVGAAMKGLGPGAVVVDAGAGRRCSFAEYRPAGVRIVGVDAVADELRLNPEIDSWQIADVCRHLPFGDGEVAVVASKHAVEHLDDARGFAAEAHRVLRPGGWFINLFPARWSAAAVLNRALPPRLAEAVLHRLHPETESRRRWQVRYDRCTFSQFGRLLRSTGFTVERAEVSYYQSHYFGFLVPLYLASAAWELVPYALGLRDLAASLFFAARRTGPG